MFWGLVCCFSSFLLRCPSTHTHTAPGDRPLPSGACHMSLSNPPSIPHCLLEIHDLQGPQPQFCLNTRLHFKQIHVSVVSPLLPCSGGSLGSYFHPEDPVHVRSLPCCVIPTSIKAISLFLLRPFPSFYMQVHLVCYYFPNSSFPTALSFSWGGVGLVLFCM